MRETNIRTYGQVVERAIWRVRTDQELRELFNDLDIVAHTGMDWTCSKNESGWRVKKIFGNKPEGSRKR